MTANGWQEWSHHVLIQLEALDSDIKTLSDRVVAVRLEVARLQVKAGVWGALAGLIPSVIMLTVALIAR